jgi:hypothetical protein
MGSKLQNLLYEQAISDSLNKDKLEGYEADEIEESYHGTFKVEKTLDEDYVIHTIYSDVIKILEESGVEIGTLCSYNAFKRWFAGGSK